jgi:enoyl-CoA hydratase/carnithine racemase
VSKPEKLRRLRVEEIEPGLPVVMFGGPERRNALDTATCEDLREVFGALAFTPGDLPCIGLAGAGGQAFSAGGDLKERNGTTDEAWRLQHATFEESASYPEFLASCHQRRRRRLRWRMRACVVLRLHHGGDGELRAAGSHTRHDAGGGGTQNLPRAVGERRARQIILSGQPPIAERPTPGGMVNEVVEHAARARAGAHDRRQRADRRAAGEEGDPPRPAGRSCDRYRDRSVGL